ncbi:MAG TPA: heavy metal translocating P-type ATPase [Bacteroidales bacterium]
MAENIKLALPVTGMSCASCAISVESMLKTQTGVKKASVNYGDRSVHVEFDNSATSLGLLRKAVQDIGYDLMIDLDDVQEKLEAIDRKQMKSMLYKLLVAIVCSLPVLAISMLNHHITSADRWWMLALSLPVILYSGSQFYVTAWKQAIQGSANMDTLVATGTGAAFLFSLMNTIAPQLLAQQGQPTHVYFESAVIIITFILTGRVLEEKAKHRASAAIKKLAGLQPKTITVSRDGERISVSPALVQPGDQMEVKPGDRIPADGKVVEGESYVDQSSITGEPVPVFKIMDEKVFAGTLNQQGNLLIEATGLGSDSLLSHIIGLVQEAQSGKPPIQQLVDRIASIFVPVVLIIGLLTFITWFFAGPEPTLNYAVIATLSVLIIACPCALGLATPTALIVGLGRGASHGILVKDVSSLQMAYKVDTVIVDKTGTITMGKPLVSDIKWFGDRSPQDLASIVYSLETRSQHPLAESLCKYLKAEFPEIINAETSVTGFTEKRGAGVQAEISAKSHFAGNEAYMRDMNVPINSQAKDLISELKTKARTLILVGNSDELLALIGMSDTLKPGAAEAVIEFNNMGIEVIMLTGDQPEAANFIAGQAGIKRVIAGALPHEKGDFIKKLQAENRTVAMIGDGINDSYALAQADVGIAMAKGSDIALDSAGITLMGSNLKQAVAAFRLSKAIIRKIRQNLFWAFSYNIIAIPLAAGVLFPINGMMLSPMIAGAAMAMSSVSVVVNSLRLLSVKI